MIYSILALILGALPWDIRFNSYLKTWEAKEEARKYSGEDKKKWERKIYDKIALKLKKMDARKLFREFDIYDDYYEFAKIYEHCLKLGPQDDPNYDIIDVSKRF